MSASAAKPKIMYFVFMLFCFKGLVVRQISPLASLGRNDSKVLLVISSGAVRRSREICGLKIKHPVPVLVQYYHPALRHQLPAL